MSNKRSYSMVQNELNEDDIELILALSNVIIAKVLDELEPNSDKVSVSNLALATMALHTAAESLKRKILQE